MAERNSLEIRNLYVKVENKEIIKSLSLTIKSGEIHTIMGPNGSGKSSLLNAIFAHPKYKITKGSIKFNGKDLRKLATDEIARLGIFLGLQYPTEIPGVSFTKFLRTAKNLQSENPHIRPDEFIEMLEKTSKTLGFKSSLLERELNEGFSGGEKKRAEIVQMAILKPKIAVLDEIDSGLDVDALKNVAKNLEKIQKNDKTGILLITHYERILKYLVPNYVHIMIEGEIIKSGTKALAKRIEKHGYEEYINISK